MSRSNPTSNAPNPATRYFEWKGKKGHFQYYDKDHKQNVDVKLPFRFILLDFVGAVGGFSEKLQSGMRSNEIMDTRSEPFVVKLNKTGEVVASGLWASIKDKVNARGGGFEVHCYIGFKDNPTGPLRIGKLQLGGCSLGAWIEFKKANKGKMVDVNGQKVEEIFAKAMVVKTTKEGQKGVNKFLSPVFEIADISSETNLEAIALDKLLQDYFKDYFRRPKSAQAEHQSEHEDEAGYKPSAEPEPEPEDENVPF